VFGFDVKLLKLILRQRATELRLQSDTQPAIVIRGETHSATAASMSGNKIIEFLKSIATAAQLRELEACGDVHFIYVFRAVRFAINATMNRDQLSVNVRTLSSQAC
jgi:Tfp pilus assembly ATPase PilU